MSQELIKLLIPPTERQLSDFMTGELVFDYWLGDLDESRASSIKQALEIHPERLEDLEKIKQGHFLISEVRAIKLSLEGTRLLAKTPEEKESSRWLLMLFWIKTHKSQIKRAIIAFVLLGAVSLFVQFVFRLPEVKKLIESQVILKVKTEPSSPSP